MVDNSAAFRMERDVPLVVPEVNQDALRHRPRGIVSNANCTTMAMIMAIAPLHREYGLRELVLASYQAVVRRRADRRGHPARPAQQGGRRPVARLPPGQRPAGGRRRPRPVPGAAGAQRGALVRRRSADDGWSSEELKLRNESRKILGLPDLKVSATCVRVPVVTGHSIAVHAVFGSEVDAEGAREVLRNAPGVILVDDPAAGEFPMPIDAVGTDPSWVGRIRRAMDDPRALDLFVTGDNMRKGAALNTVADRRAAGQGTDPLGQSERRRRLPQPTPTSPAPSVACGRSSPLSAVLRFAALRGIFA